MILSKKGLCFTVNLQCKACAKNKQKKLQKI